VEPWLFSAACATLAFWLASSLPAAAAQGAPTRMPAHAVVASWAIAAVASSLIGMLQYVDLARHLSPWINIAPLGEAFGNLRQRNQLASLTNIGLLALMWLAALSPYRRAWMTAGVVTAVVLLSAGNAATTSRTGLMQLLLITLLAVVWDRRSFTRRIALCGVALASYLVAAVALPEMLEQVTGQRGNSLLLRLSEEPRCLSRRVLWSNVLDLIAQKPWFGWGWGELDYAHFITLYEGPRFCDILDNAHNLPLHLAVELGMPAAMLLCGGIAFWVMRARPWAETDPTRQLAWGALALIGVHSLLEYPLWYGPFQMTAGLCLWLLWQGHEPHDKAPTDHEPRFSATVARIAVPTMILAGLAYAAWDYRRISQIYLPAEQRAIAYRDDTIQKLRDSWLFRDQVRFADLTITPLTRGNAAWTYQTASELLHYSPEPRVVEKLIESAVLLDRDDEALVWLARYRAAFPAEHARWAKGLAKPLDLAPSREIPSGR
jgi:O-antigen ligase